MPLLLNGVPLPLTVPNQQAIAAAKRRADLIGVHTATEILAVDVRTLRRWYQDNVGPKRKSREGKRPILYSRTEVQQFAATLNGKRLGRVQTLANGRSESDRVQTLANGQSKAPVNKNLEIK